MADHAQLIPLYRALPRLARDPLGTFERVGAAADRAVVRLNLGPFRPYLVTRPADVQHVLRDNAANYLRDGMMWAPLRRLFGDGLASEGPTWAARRRLVQPLLSGRHIASLIAPMWAAITAAVDALKPGEPLDLVTEMTRVIERALIEAFFGGRISPADADRLGRAVATAFTSMGARMLLPFVPETVPLPGDARFHRAVRTVDEVMLPLVRDARGDTGADLVSVLGRADAGLDDRQIRDDMVAMFVAGSETTAVALSFSSVDYFERRRTPFVVAVNCFDGARRYEARDVRLALDLDPGAPVVFCDARDRESSKAVLIAVIKHARSRLARASTVEVRSGTSARG